MKTNHKYYFDLINAIKEIEENTIRVSFILDEVIADSNKDYTITHGNKTFKFFNPSTSFEGKQQAAHRKTLINRLLKDCLRAMINESPGAWDPILAFTQGEDPADHKFEIIREEYEVDLDESGNPIKSKPLNVDSIYVEWQDQNKYELKSFDEFLRKRFTPAEIEAIEKEAREEIESLRKNNV